MFMQNFNKLCAAVHALSYSHTKKNKTQLKTILPSVPQAVITTGVIDCFGRVLQST